jgi:alkylhydroperoxidase family enzyme
MDRGLTEEKIAAMGNWATDPMFSDRERLALELADTMAMNHEAFGADEGDDLFIRLRKIFTDEELVELGMAIGQYLGFGRFLHAFQVVDPVCKL